MPGTDLVRCGTPDIFRARDRSDV